MAVSVNLQANPRSAAALVLAQSGAPASVTSTTSETALATITIPAGSVGPNGRIRVTALFQAPVNANNNVYRVKVAGNNLFSSGTVASVAAYQVLANIAAPNSTGSLNGAAISGGGGTGTAVFTATVDMTQAQSLTITAHPGSASDTITLLNYAVEILNP